MKAQKMLILTRLSQRKVISISIKKSLTKCLIGMLVFQLFGCNPTGETNGTQNSESSSTTNSTSSAEGGTTSTGAAIVYSAAPADSTLAEGSKMLSGHFAWNSTGEAISGTMADRSNTWDLTTAFPGSGYYAGISSGLSQGDVCSAKSFLGAQGTATCVLGTADATQANVLSGKTFWNASGAPVSGTMTNQGSWTLTGVSSAFPGAGYYSGVASSPSSAAICSGTTVVGISGGATCQGSAGTGTIATAAQIGSGYYSYDSSGNAVNGSAVIPISITDWSARAAGTDGQKATYTPTGVNYTYSTAVGDWIRSEIKSGSEILDAKIIGNVTPDNETPAWTVTCMAAPCFMSTDGTKVTIGTYDSTSPATKTGRQHIRYAHNETGARHFMQGYFQITNINLYGGTNWDHGVFYISNGTKGWALQSKAGTDEAIFFNSTSYPGAIVGLMAKSVNLVTAEHWIEFTAVRFGAGHKM